MQPQTISCQPGSMKWQLNYLSNHIITIAKQISSQCDQPFVSKLTKALDTSEAREWQEISQSWPKVIQA